VPVGPGATALTGQHVNQPFDAGFGRDVRPVCRECLCEDAAGERDNAAARRNMLRGLRHDEKCAAQVCLDHLVERTRVGFAYRRQRHDARIVHDNVHASEGFECLGKQVFHVGPVTDAPLIAIARPTTESP